MIIDAHTHLFGDAKEGGDALLRSMELCGVDMAIVSCLDSRFPDKDEVDSLNKKTYDFAKAHTDKIRGACYVNPKNDNCVSVIERGIEDMNMCMIKLWLSCACDDMSVNAVAETAIKYNIPILIHTFFMHNGNPPYESTGMHVRNLALRYPEAKLIMAHFGGNPYHGIRAVKDCKNVYTDYAGTFYGYNDINYTVEQLGTDRIVFGTDFPIASELFGMGKIESANLSAANKQMIYSDNILRLLDTSYRIGNPYGSNANVDVHKKYDAEYIDVNAMFGPLPYFKTPYPTLDALEEKRGNDSESLIVSSLDSLFFQDSREADERFIYAECGDNIKKAATLNPTMPSALSDLREYSGRISAVKIAPYLHGYSLSDRRVIEFAHECARLSIPLMLVSRVFDERQQYCIKSGKTDVDDIRNFITAAPDTTIVLLSLRHNEAETLGKLEKKNVFFDTSGFKGGAFTVEHLIESIGASQLMYGSMSPIYNEKSVLYCISGADIPAEIKKDILINNAKNVFNL